MRSILLAILLLSVLVSCGDYRKTKSGYIIKGKSEIVFREIDNALNDKSAICGYVYSKDMKEFIEQAYVKIGNQEYQTDQNGYFNAVIESGQYTVSTSFVGNTEEKITGLQAEKNKRVMIIFQLGTATITCH